MSFKFSYITQFGLILALATACCSVKFSNVNLISVRHNSQENSSQITIRFELKDGEIPLSGLPRDSFRAYEDGIPATSESFTNATDKRSNIEVVLLLDTSKSLYDAPGEFAKNAVIDLKRSAHKLIEDIGGKGYYFTIYHFSNSLKKVNRLSQISDNYQSKEGLGRWTALYSSLKKVIKAHPGAVFVLFSDGADNYSQNYKVSLGDVTQAIEQESAAVHAIAFGNIDKEFDRTGVPGLEALEKLSSKGSLQYADSASDFDVVFYDILKRLKAIYTFDYFSPNLSGKHNLVIEVDNGWCCTEQSKIVEFEASDKDQGDYDILQALFNKKVKAKLRLQPGDGFSTLTVGQPVDLLMEPKSSVSLQFTVTDSAKEYVVAMSKKSFRETASVLTASGSKIVGESQWNVAGASGYRRRKFPKGKYFLDLKNMNRRQQRTLVVVAEYKPK